MAAICCSTSAEAVRGRPLPQRAQEYGFRAGLRWTGLLVRLRDLERSDPFGLFRWVAGLIGLRGGLTDLQAAQIVILADRHKPASEFARLLDQTPAP